jgi:hypothetical protein
MRLVNGKPGSALASRLAWDRPLKATILSAQLLELGKAHAQVYPLLPHQCTLEHHVARHASHEKSSGFAACSATLLLMCRCMLSS